MARRVELSAHLRECSRCDRSFRVFALSAPVLHSNSEPERRTTPIRTGSLRPVRALNGQLKRNPYRARHASGWGGAVAAFMIAAAAGIAAYVAVTPKVTFEDAIVADNSGASVSSYNTSDSSFSQEIMGQDTAAQDPNLQNASFEE
jgi:hypothetical protein